MDIHQLSLDINSFAVFRHLINDPVIHAFCRLLTECNEVTYAEFVSALYNSQTDNWGEYLTKAVLNEETCLVAYASSGKPIPEYMEEACLHELGILSDLCAIGPYSFSIPGYRAKWKSTNTDLKTLYLERLEQIEKYGFGKYAKNHMFRLTDRPEEACGYSIEAVAYPDEIKLSDLIGYDLQHNQVLSNTEILINGRLASNVLLYGDAGTGKSATVKAIVNELKDQGLRLIELSKDQLHFLPNLMDTLSTNPLKFVLFVDDLSFQEDDDDFAALKAVLEGSASVRSKNTVIYATSNRRHIVKETFSQREGNEIHKNDTMQETISLSERFGVKVYYEKPKKDLYLQIVDGLASQYGINMNPEELHLKAEQFALRKAGRSARAARQLVEQLAALQ